MVVGDAERNALIVLATGDQIKNIREVVNRIDVEKPQVYIVAKIVEVDVKKAENIGINYGIRNLSLAERIQKVITPTGLTKLPGISTLANSLPVGIGTLGKFLAMGAQIDFLKTNGAAQVLSEPSVLCTNNKESEIYVGQVRSILVSSAAGDNKNDNVRNNYSREDIGITLKVKPRLSSNNKVALEVEANIEDVDESDTQSVDRPTTTKRKVNTNAIVNNGQTIILGGLIKSTRNNSTSKLPILGDIPILGTLFRSNGKNIRKINVVIYLTPYIVRKSSDLTKLKEFLSDLNGIQARFNEMVRQRLEKNQHYPTGKTIPRSTAVSRTAPTRQRQERRRPSPMDILNGRHSSHRLSKDPFRGEGNY
jgi:general secretion pathway protein D